MATVDPALVVAGCLAGGAGWQLTATLHPGQSSLTRLGAPAGGRRSPWRGHWVGIGIRGRRRLTTYVLLIMVGVIKASGLPWVPIAILGGAARVLGRRHRKARLARAAAAARAVDVRTLRALAAELRSGLAPAAALRVAASNSGQPRTGGVQARMLEAAAAEALGGEPAAVLSAGAAAGSPAAALGMALYICRRTGARLAAPVSRIADGAAADLRIERETEAALAAARSSARLLAALPAAGVVLGALSGTGALRVLLLTGLGQLCLLGGVALDLVGLAWLDRLARSP